MLGTHEVIDIIEANEHLGDLSDCHDIGSDDDEPH